MCIATHTDTPQGPAREINEAVLAAVWNEQAPLRGPMWDCVGDPVAVVYRGRWSAGSGPDFEGAMLALGEGGAKLTTGSVEVHLRCADWWAHGHHTDPRYNSVILHVVMWPAGARPVVRADGQMAPTLVLADYITASSAELLERVAPLVANLGALSEEPCWKRTAHRPLEDLLGNIGTAGDDRLLARAAAMEADLGVYASADEVFYRGLMDALGYSANREPMRALASLLPVSQLLTLPLTANEDERAALLESVLLGAAGFLPSQRPGLGPLDWLSSAYAEEVEEVWASSAPVLGLPTGRGAVDGWTPDRVRPANSPPRRLAAAARLLARLLWQPGGMLGPFLELAGSSPAIPPGRLAVEWRRLLAVPGEGYWASHSDFGRSLAAGTRAGEATAALVGGSRAADMVVNVLLPLLVACSEQEWHRGAREAAMAVYSSHPRLAENRITRAMGEEVLGPRRDGAIDGARRQQGLIHLYRRYCEARRCFECPMAGAKRDRPRAPWG